MGNVTVSAIKRQLTKLSSPKQAAVLQRFFKTGKGEYGEGDVFLGIKVPVQRKVAKEYINMPISDVQKLLNSKIHEHRLVGLFIIVNKYKKGGLQEKKKIYNFYLKNKKNINNWDLVDVTAPVVVGDYLLDKPRDVLYKLAKSEKLWDRRIAILSTFSFIKKNDFADALKISEILLSDNHDLMHKAVGWMLREVGKRDQVVEERFLHKYYRKMPRTMLRYAIERFSETKRKSYLSK